MRRNTWLVTLLSFMLVLVGLVPVHAESSVLGAQDNPVPVGKPILLASGTVQEYVAVSEVNRGDSAWQRIHRYNAKNTPPEPGKEYLMALVIVRYVTGPEDQASLNFELHSNQDVSKNTPTVLQVRPDFEIVYTPDTMSGGWIIRQVDPGDPNPLLAVHLGAGDDNTQKTVYFATTEN